MKEEKVHVRTRAPFPLTLHVLRPRTVFPKRIVYASYSIFLVLRLVWNSLRRRELVIAEDPERPRKSCVGGVADVAMPFLSTKKNKAHYRNLFAQVV
jgi:hypothetical protein